LCFERYVPDPDIEGASMERTTFAADSGSGVGLTTELELWWAYGRRHRRQ
jgi:hypothetical protein